jgi:alpha-glucoside transport system permease protein
LTTLGFVVIAIDLVATVRTRRAPGMAWRRLPVFSWATAIGSWLLLFIGPVMIAASTMLLIDRNFEGIFFAGGAGGAPLLWQHLSWIFFTGAYMLVLIAALAAYAFAWVDFRGREFLFLFVVSLLVVPLQMALIPVARLYGDIGIFDTVYGAILFHLGFGLPFAVFLLRNFFIGIPHELLEAARIDGASEWQIFFRIMLPLGMPAIASLMIFQFLWTWNDLLVALVFAPGEAAPITVYIREQLRQFGTNLEVIAPGAFVSMIVPLAVFFLFQRYFVQGLLAGSVK